MGNQKYEEVEVVLPRFKATTVFDIGQTDGKPIQTITPEELIEAVEDSEQGERVGRVLHPENYSKTSEELMFAGEQRYAIYQIDENASLSAYRFMGMEHLKNRGVEVSADNYNCVYFGRLLDSDKVDDLYAIFNTRHPADYKTYSMSVSDVVIMNQEGQLQAYYVDSFGFEAIPDFVKQRQVVLGMIVEPEMIDFSKVQEGISSYAAECSEFPVLGEVFQNLTLPEALDYVEKYMAERSRNVDKITKKQVEGEKVERQKTKPQKRREEMSLWVK